MTTILRFRPADLIPREQRRPSWAASRVPARKRWKTTHRDPQGNIVAEAVNMWMTTRAWREFREAYPEETDWQAMPFGDFILAQRVTTRS